METSEFFVSKNPNDQANPISKTFFLWTIPMFRAGYTKMMEMNDLFGPKESDRSGIIGADLERHWNNQVKRCEHTIKTKNITDPKKMPKPNLILALLYTFKWHFTWLGFIICINEFVCRLIQPMLLGRLLSFFKLTPEISREEALLTAGGIILLNFVSALAMNHYTLGSFHMGMRARVAVCSLIYRKIFYAKSTQLSAVAEAVAHSAVSSPGKVVNLLSNDVNRFDICSFFIHYMWVLPVAALLVMVLLVYYLNCRQSLKLSRTALADSSPGKVVNLLSNDVNRFDICSLFIHYMWVLPVAALLVMVLLFYYLNCRQSLKLSRTALGDSTPGKVVNLLSNDVNRFDICSFFIHYMWVAPVAALLVMVLLFREVGVSGVLGILVVFTVMPLQGYTGKLSARFRLQTAIRTDERVRLMNEIISGVQVIKMYTWERPFAKLVELARRMELKIVRKNSYVRALFMSFMLFTTRAATYCTMASLVLYGETLTAAKVFVFAQYFSALSMTMSAMFVRAIAETSEAWVSAKRLQAYLVQDEFVASRAITDGREKNAEVKDIAVLENGALMASGDAKKSRCAIKLNKASARWLESDDDLTLKNVCLDVGKGKLVGIIGPVGSGKSSILQAILGELPLSAGTVQVNGRVSYASQEAWLFGSTLRQNILFGLPYDQFRYNEVVRVCSLQKDFQQFSHGDQTLVGDKGTSLSGGQKARINLARAVYREADIYLLDDPLSAVDAHVGRHLYDKCIRTHLRKSTRVLVTHQLHYLTDADHIVIMNNGRIEMQGSYHDIATGSLEYARLLIPAPEKAIETDKQEQETRENKERKAYRRLGSRRNSASSYGSMRSTSVSSSYVDLTELSLDDPNNFEDKPQEAVVETSSKGLVKGSVEMHYVRAGAGKVSLVLMLLLFLAAQCFASYFDYFVSFWTAQEERRAIVMANQNQTDGAHFFNATEEFSFDSEGLLPVNTLITVGGVTVVLILVVGLVRAVLYYNACIRASQNLHDLMFRGIIRSPMKFFDDTPTGRIMNRFSKDMGAVDELLPKAFMDAAQQLLTMCGAIALAAVVNPSFLAALAIIAVLFYFIRKVYLVASKNIKRLEGITRSPVFSHLGSTLAGLPTIRVNGAQEIIQKEFDKLQDVHSSAFYMFISTSTGFGFTLDLIFLIFVTVIMFSFFFVGKDIMGDKVGLAITQAMSLTFLVQYGVRQSAEVANQMMAVERLLEYTQLDSENGIKPDKIDERAASKGGRVLRTFRSLPRDWPEHGCVQFRDVSMKYGPGESDSYVLKRLNFTIGSKEKVGIVGRTGAGKSSIIQAMFRLAFVEGDIIIDGVNTADITLEDLRKQLSIIPQDPMLFSGTLRRNLDPFEEYSDDLLWQALDQVELKESVSSPSGLEQRVMDGGANFSVGQRQLICLARALLRNNRVLMMDEATANVDPHTDSLIQQTIRTKFTDCTVLTIAHRLNTIVDSDKVLVMELGQVVEFDHPYILLQKKGEVPEEDGYFRKMLLETGADNFNKLEQLARECYLRKTSQ